MDRITGVALVVKPDPEAEKNADALEDWFLSRGVDVFRKGRVDYTDTVPDGIGCVVVMGGDGTFLSAARWIGDLDIPVLGIKFGGVGFLSETVEDDLFSAAQKILNGEFSIAERMRLCVTVFENGRQCVQRTVLNDVVINKGALARLAHIKTFIDGYDLTTYHGDGLIVATPTGSTAYSLAAGGPVIHPAVPGIILTPICPFTLTNRPLVVPDGVSIGLRLDQPSSDIMVTLDGQEGVEINETHSLVIKKADHPVRMIILPGQRYFDVLKAKLKWGGGPASM
ncbi:MAG: NAD(+) kinase [Desulfococcus sp. 4484_241]|nr:MAG: NAD(+) kinase [Desulfococcus sp. 4484_241]